MLNRKALSPVIATIILIAIAVGVSVAVAYWTGAFSGNSPTPLGSVYFNVISWNNLPNSINVTITNNMQSAIYLEKLLINNATAVSYALNRTDDIPLFLAVPRLSIGSTNTTLVNYNWTYNTAYTFTLVWFKPNPDDSAAEIDKEYNSSEGPFWSPTQKRTVTWAIPTFDNADYATWNWDYVGHNYPQYTSDMLSLPANMTIDITYIVNGTRLAITVSYYQLQAQSLFTYIGEKDYLFVVTN